MASGTNISRLAVVVRCSERQHRDYERAVARNLVYIFNQFPTGWNTLQKPVAEFPKKE